MTFYYYNFVFLDEYLVYNALKCIKSKVITINSYLSCTFIKSTNKIYQKAIKCYETFSTIINIPILYMCVFFFFNIYKKYRK